MEVFISQGSGLSVFVCPHCREALPDYYVPCPRHQRVPVICFSCHLEQADIRPRRKSEPPPDLSVEITDRQYRAWRLTAVNGHTQEQAAQLMAITQPAVSQLLAGITAHKKPPKAETLSG